MGRRRTYNIHSSMRRRSASATFVTFLLILFSSARIESIELFGAPLITPSETDVTVLPSENYSFSCQSSEPITWTAPNEEEQNTDKYEIHNSKFGNYFESKLKLKNIDYTFVGYYSCVKQSAASEQIEDAILNNDASQIYLFVDDPRHPIAEQLVPIVSGVQDQEVIIPCKPTSKMVSVQLIKEGDESHKFESTFSPTEGYRIRLAGLTDGGSYTCHAKQDLLRENDVHFHVEVNSGTTYINKPKIFSNTDGFGIEGEQLEFNCSVEYDLDTTLMMSWNLPNDGIAQKENRVITSGPIRHPNERNSNINLAVGHLTVQNLDKTKDVGTYECFVKDNSNSHNKAVKKIFTILDAGESFINITEPSQKYSLEISSSKNEAKWYVKYVGYPTPTIIWRDPHNNEIPWREIESKDQKLEAMHDATSTTLKIRNPRISDSGSYTLYAHNGKMEKEQKFNLYVKEKPQVSLSPVTVLPGETAKLTCDIFGYPSSAVTWSFIPCTSALYDAASCEAQADEKKITFTNGFEVGHDEIIKTVETTKFNQTSTIEFKPNVTGIVICSARNKMNTTKAQTNVIVTDVNEGLSIWCNNDLPISVGDEVQVTCGASAHKYAADLKWFRGDKEVESSEDVFIEEYNTEFSYQKTLHWTSVSKAAFGQYVCRAGVIRDDTYEEKTWDLEISEPREPKIEDTNINESEHKHQLGEPLQLKCKFSGIPRPEIHWYRDNRELTPNKQISLRDNNTVLDIRYITIEDEGKYKCVVSNRLGSAVRETSLKIKNPPTVGKGVIIGVIAIILVLVICTIYLCLRIRRERRLFRELKAAGLADFERGNPDSINPELAVDEQADLLPYDKKYEFPREKLKLGKQLGAGAFGVVIKGYAQGILSYEDETTVAVKMVKQMADNGVMRALISELKIMVHLGQHLNVVNLLGAVTKNIAKREVMVIVEYCRFGNLQNFLVKHRQYFVDQILRDKDIIDPTITTKEQRWSNDSGYAYYNRPEADRQSLGAVSHVNSAYIRHSNVVGDYFPGGMDSANTEATLISRNTNPGGEENMVMSNNSTQPAWRSNYRMDYKGPARSVTTTDLLCWAFQVARGMDYLASRKVLHGDLAARNILLSDDNVVKICDFGLARSMYKTDNYRKTGEALLPFKWLALESISDQIFSTYSDIWSYGIVLWELFSLGQVPYPGMDADQGLYFKLKDGYRMEKPPYATQDIYDIMLSCWCANPESRPLFDNLEKSVGKLLENGVAEHYIDLNEPYLKSNVSNFTGGQTDYLALMAAPECPAPAVPHYVNSQTGFGPPTTDAPPKPASYLTMSPTINSPLASGIDTHDTHFQFPSLNSPTTTNNLNASEPSTKYRNKITNIPEEIPMLKRSNQSIHSDSDTEVNTSDVVITHPDNSSKNNVSVFSTNGDNYVNVPSTIINMNKKDAVSNPGYVVVNETRT